MKIHGKTTIIFLDPFCIIISLRTRPREEEDHSASPGIGIQHK